MLIIEKLGKRFGEKTVFENLSFICKDVGVTAIMGTSGIGKTTLLNIITGLEKATEGKITSTFSKISYKFQEPRLFEWLTALENVAVVIDNKQEGESIARELLCAVGLSESLDKYPTELSGGMQQRVSLARTLAHGGDLLILDEPFSAVDVETRDVLISVVAEYAKSHAVLLVTHSQEEAEALDADIITLE